MVLFTSIFRPEWHRVSFLLAVVGFGIMTSVFYHGNVSPEVAFWRTAVDSKFQYLGTLDPDVPKVVFVGGSSCAFSINAKLLKDKFDVQALNCGLIAGAGRDLQLDLGISTLNAGDVLVLAFETHDWGYNNVSFETPLGSQLWFTAVKPHTKTSALGEIGRRPHYHRRDLRIGGKHAVTMGLKAVLRRPLYRYSSEGIEPGGYLTTSYRDGTFGPSSAVIQTNLSAQMRDFLVKTRYELAQREIEVFVSFPWFFMTSDVALEQRAVWQQLAEEISKFVPVLYDSNFGVSTEVEDFADTAWHLSRNGAMKRTLTIGESLRNDSDGKTLREK